MKALKQTQLNYSNLTDLLISIAHTYGKKNLFFEKVGTEWRGINMIQHLQLVMKAMSTLKSFGLIAGDSIGLVASNSHTWQILEHAALVYGLELIAVETHAQVDHIKCTLAKKNVSLVVVENEMVAQKLVDSEMSCKMIDIKIMGNLILNQSSVVMMSSQNLTTSRTTIFTSGTTGTPKSITYSQDQIVMTAKAVLEQFGSVNENDRTLSWLPMANLFQRNMNLISIAKGVPVYFLNSPEKLMQTLVEVKPTIIITVPRFLEKIYGQINSIKNRLPKFLQSILNPIFNSVLKKKLGGALRFVISGSAKCSLEILNHFQSLNIPVLEAYGLSECILPIALNSPEINKIGSVGKILAPNQVRISADGEILVTSPGLGAHKELCTGDLGHIDSEGFLFVKGRINDLVKTSTGRKVSLSRLDQFFFGLPYTEQVITLAENLPFVCVVVAGAKNLTAKQKNEIEKGVQQKNQVLSSFEQVRAVIFVNETFTIENQLVTNNLKLRRNKISERYKKQIDSAVQTA